jgi:hypothetical protein
MVLASGCNREIERPATDDLTLAQATASCAYPELDGHGSRASDIPVAHTPNCRYTTFPDPVLAACGEPLAPGAADLRGVWVDLSVPHGHLERIEQCGDRVTITAAGIIHDMRTDDTYEHGVNDVSERGCMPISVKAEFVDGVHTLHPKWLPLTVTRRLDGDRLVWDYPTGVYRLTRLCGPAARSDPAQVVAMLHATPQSGDGD